MTDLPARSHLTNVQLTLLSIIVALVLENLLSHLSSIGIADIPWPNAARPWLETAAVLTSVVATWAGFGLSFSFSSARPHPFDFLSPFVLLIMLYIAVQYIGHDTPAPFLLSIGASSLAAALMLWIELRRASGVGADAAFVAQLGIGLWYVAAAGLTAYAISSFWITAGLIAIGAVVQSVAVFEIFKGWRVLVGDQSST